MRWSSTLAALVLALPTAATADWICGTDQNPYCNGNDKFQAVCCTYPNVCYWADRQGTPACCPAGQSCLDYQGIVVQPQPVEAPPTTETETIVPAPAPSTVYSTVQPEPSTVYSTVYPVTTQQPPLSTVTSYVAHPPSPTQEDSLVYVTTTEPGVFESATSGFVSAVDTGVQLITGNEAAATSMTWALTFTLAVAVVAAWLMV